MEEEKTGPNLCCRCRQSVGNDNALGEALLVSVLQNSPRIAKKIREIEQLKRFERGFVVTEVRGHDGR